MTGDDMTGRPLVSVVVPTRNRWEALDRCLSALLVQDWPVDRFEVIVVNDGGTDGTGRVLARRAGGAPRLRCIHAGGRGPAAARNAGIRSARGTIVAFTDDDCIPDPDWLRMIAERLERADLVGVGGLTYSDPDSITPFTHQVEDAHPYSFPTCNVAYRREALAAAGGFDEDYPHPYNEDWDLVFAMQRIGVIAYEPFMRVRHPPRPVTFMHELSRLRYLASEFRLFTKYREQYRASVHRHPWRVILYHHGLVQPVLRLVRHGRRAARHPWLFIRLLALLIIERLYLLWLLPGFINHDRRERERTVTSCT
ncbi:glycosyltransferase [bacterium]|nr:glycosyltransferase [candidate division CSSED10-310 bacterium]